MQSEIQLGRGRAMTPREIQEFLADSPFVSYVATIQADGSPYVNPMWYEHRDGSFIIITKETAQITLNLRRDPRATIVIASPTPPYRRVLAQCRAEQIAEDWIPTAERMVRRYVGEQGLQYLHATANLPRVVFLLHGDRTTSWNAGGIDRSFFQPAVWHDTV